MSRERDIPCFPPRCSQKLCNGRLFDHRHVKLSNMDGGCGVQGKFESRATCQGNSTGQGSCPVPLTCFIRVATNTSSYPDEQPHDSRGFADSYRYFVCNDSSWSAPPFTSRPQSSHNFSSSLSPAPHVADRNLLTRNIPPNKYDRAFQSHILRRIYLTMASRASTARSQTNRVAKRRVSGSSSGGVKRRARTQRAGWRMSRPFTPHNTIGGAVQCEALISG